MMTSDDDRGSDGAQLGADDVPPSMPKWVKYLLLGVAAVVVIAILAMLIVGGDHGPGRHGGSPSTPEGPDTTVALT